MTSTSPSANENHFCCVSIDNVLFSAMLSFTKVSQRYCVWLKTKHTCKRNCTRHTCPQCTCRETLWWAGQEFPIWLTRDGWVSRQVEADVTDVNDGVATGEGSRGRVSHSILYLHWFRTSYICRKNSSMELAVFWEHRMKSTWTHETSAHNFWWTLPTGELLRSPCLGRSKIEFPKTAQHPQITYKSPKSKVSFQRLSLATTQENFMLAEKNKCPLQHKEGPPHPTWTDWFLGPFSSAQTCDGSSSSVAGITGEQHLFNHKSKSSSVAKETTKQARNNRSENLSFLCVQKDTDHHTKRLF